MLQALMDPLAPQEPAGRLPEERGADAKDGAWGLRLVRGYKLSVLRILKSAEKSLGAVKAKAIADLL